MKNLLIISNDKIFFSKSEISSKFNDTVNIIEALQKRFNIFLVSRKNKKRENFSLKKKIIIRLTFNKFFSLKKKKIKLLMISITPWNIFIYLLIKIFLDKVNGFIYLRSDGFKEYQTKLGKLGLLFFTLMTKIIDKNFKIISVNKNIKSKKIDTLIIPSELDKNWFNKKKVIQTSYPKLLYLGRFKKEKGVFSLIELFKNQTFKFQLTIAGDNKLLVKNDKIPTKIKFVNQLNDQKQIINLYNSHNIFILPSYTEGSPKVILESLARKRPVVIFNEIKHVKSNFRGIFISKRNMIDLKATIKYILNNYSKIQKDMKLNKLQTKKNFQKKLIETLDG